MKIIHIVSERTLFWDIVSKDLDISYSGTFQLCDASISGLYCLINTDVIYYLDFINISRVLN